MPWPSSASSALTIRFVHTWLSCEPWARTRGSSAVVQALDPHVAVLQPVAEHPQRRLEALVDVDLADVVAVHVRVLLDRPDELGDAAGALVQLVDQAVGVERRRQTPGSGGRGRALRSAA